MLHQISPNYQCICNDKQQNKFIDIAIRELQLIPKSVF